MQRNLLSTRAGRFYWAVTGWPKTVVIVGLLLLAVPGAFYPTLGRDSRIEAFVPADHPAMVYRAKVKQMFGLGDPLAIAIVNEGPTGVFNPHALQLVAWLTDQLATTPGIDPERITSLATVDKIVGGEEGMDVTRFFKRPPQTQGEADRVRDAVMDFDLLLGRLVARNGTATVVLAEPLSEGNAEEVYANVLALTQRAPVGDERIYVAGGGAVTATMGKYIYSDTTRLSPIAVLVITAVLIVAYRTATGVLIPFMLIGAAVTFAMGSMAMAHVPINVITNTLPVVMIVIAVSEGIHILGEYYEQRAAHPECSQRELVVRTMTRMWRPVAVTSFNDIVGFTAIYFSSWMPPMRSLAVFGSMGRLAQFAFALVIVPAALALWRTKPSPAFRQAGTRPTSTSRMSGDRFSLHMGMLGRWVVVHSRPVLAATAVILLLGVAGFLRLEINDSRVVHFNVHEPIRLADNVINRVLNGTSYLDVVVETEHVEDLFRPDHLRRIEALQAFLMSQPHVKGTISVVDYVKQMHRAMNENQRAFYRLPDNADLVAQYFLLYAAGGAPHDLKELIDSGYRHTNVRVTLDTGLYSERGAVIKAVQKYLDDTFNAPGIAANLAGSVYVDHHWISQAGQFSWVSTISSAFAIWLLASWSFGSFLAGALAVIPVLMAEFLIYAVMGFTGVWLGVSTSMFAAIAIGIGVDFAVHVIDRLIVFVRDERQPLDEAMARLFPSTGRAVLFSFLAVLFGFGVFLFSKVPSLVWFGSLVAVAVLTSFVFSLTVLPALVQTLQPKFLGLGAEQELQRSRLAAAVAATLVLALVLGVVSPADADDTQWPSGDEIVRRINARDEGTSVSRTLTLELSDKGGQPRVQVTRGFRKYFGGEKRTVLFYRSPANIKGTAFLTIDHPEKGKDDDQWLYLPAARKVRRISATDRGAHFLGTDFSYEDIKNETKVSLDDYVRTTVGEETVDGHTCLVVEELPVDREVAKELGYGRVRLAADAEIWIPRRFEIWDIAGNPLKTVHFRDIRQVQGVWTVHRIEGENHKTGHRSVFSFSDVDYQAGVKDELFTREALERGP